MRIYSIILITQLKFKNLTLNSYKKRINIEILLVHNENKNNETKIN